MAREDTPLDQEVFDATLAAELAKGSDRRVAEGRARSAAVRAYNAAHPEEAQPRGGRRRAAAAAGCGGGRTARRPAAGRGPGGGRPRSPSPRRSPPRARGTAAHRQPADAEEGHRRQAPAAGAGPARGHPARRARAGRPRQRVAAPADRGVRRHVHPAGGPDGLLDVRQRAAARAGQPEPHAEPVEGAVVLPGPAGAAALLPPDDRRRHDPDVDPGGLAAVPYVDRNPSIKPGDRKLAITLFTMLFMFGATLTIIGSFFRGPGFNWVWPWAQGVFFEL